MEDLNDFSITDLLTFKEEQDINSSICDIDINKNDDSNNDQTLCQTLQNSTLNNTSIYQNFELTYLFHEKQKKQIFNILKKKKIRKKRIKSIISLDGVYIPKVKHLNVEKKKNRVQYQENHKKTIYSYCHLTPPYDFEKIFDIIIEHQNRHKKVFTDKKSFHLIRDKIGNVVIVTFQEKQKIRRNYDNY
jgi:hypothetical protein